jgi:hypothetical protein
MYRLLQVTFAATYVKRRIVCALSISFVITAASAGCGDRSGRLAIDGIVKFKEGQPVDRGSIAFSPFDGDTRIISGAPVIDGHYHIPREKGLRTGRYVVRIYASAVTASPQGPPGQLGLVTPPELISPRFNTQSILVAEVRSGGDQRFDFQVE